MSHAQTPPPEFDPQPELDTARSEFDTVLAAAIDGSITAAQIQWLDARLDTDPQAVTAYVETLATHSMLHWRYGSIATPLPVIGGQEAAVRKQESDASDLPPSNNPSPLASYQPRPKGLIERTLRRNATMGIAVAVVTISSLLYALHLANVSKRLAEAEKEKAEPIAEKKQKFVAWFKGEHNAKWLEGTRPRNTRLWPGKRLKISQGLLEIEYLTGARVVIEGPATYFVGGKAEGGRMEEATEPAELARKEGEGGSFQPSNSGYLASGSLVARCESAASKGFIIETPSGRVEDLGTEFGVDVKDIETAVVRVFEGEVEVQTEAADGELFLTTLNAGQQASLTRKGSSVLVQVSASSSDSVLANLRRRSRLKTKRVVLQNATASFSQTDGGGYPVSQTIDGIVDKANGWAFAHDTGKDHVAVWETQIDITSDELAFQLVQPYNPNGFPRNLRKIRISVTSEDRGQFADGQQQAGDVDANWTVLVPKTAATNFGAAGTMNANHSISFVKDEQNTGASAATVYDITAKATLKQITGIRLEVFAEDNAVGHSPTNNAHLGEMKMWAIPSHVPSTVNQLKEK